MTNALLEQANEELGTGRDLSDADFSAVSLLYQRTVHVPDSKPIQQVLLCPVGLVGAGKSTVVKPISERLSFVRISTDEIRKLLKEQGFNYGRTREMAYRLISEFLQKGYSIAIDADCINQEARDAIKKVAEKYRLASLWIHINPPEEFIINKLRNFQHTWLFRDAKDAINNYRRRKPLHAEYLKLIDFYFTFDTSKSDLDAQINQFVEKFHHDFG